MMKQRRKREIMHRRFLQQQRGELLENDEIEENEEEKWEGKGRKDQSQNDFGNSRNIEFSPSIRP